jgi:hypothetical protein
METLVLNIVDSSLEPALHSYGLHLILAYKYEKGNYFLKFMSYLLDNHLSSLQLTQNSMAHSYKCLLLNTEKPNKVIFEN